MIPVDPDYSWGLSDEELSVVAEKMRTFGKVGNDRSYLGVQLVVAAIES